MPTFNRSDAGTTVQGYLDLKNAQRIVVVDIGGGLVDIDPTGGSAGAGAAKRSGKSRASKKRTSRAATGSRSSSKSGGRKASAGKGRRRRGN
jgi:hypothetical protein